MTKPSVDLTSQSYKQKMSLSEFAKIPPTPFQRDHVQRAKMKKVIESLSKLKIEHLEVAIAELTADAYDDDGNFYPKGSLFISNGNTRLHYWKNGLSDFVPEYVNATVYYKKNMEEVRDHYNTFDSPNAVEANAEKVAGIIRGVHNYQAKSDKVKKGQLLTSLGLACHYLQPSIYDTDKLVNIAHAPVFVSLYIEEIKAFDKICRNSKVWDTALICAALMCFKKYGTKNQKVIDCLRKIDSGHIVRSSDGPYDGVTNITHEWTNYSMFRDRKTSWSKPDNKGNIGLKYTTSFALYWIEKYLKDEKGVKPGRGWETTGEYFFKSKTTTQLLDDFFEQTNVVELKVS